MRLLLDTHVLLWWDGGQRISAAAKRAIAEADEVFVSAASAWEISIKQSLGKIVTQRSVAVATRESGFAELPISFEHAERVARLAKLHRDPFDRLLVAQALVDGLTIVTRDPSFARYAVSTIGV